MSSAQPSPTHEDIATLAYHLWEERGAPIGSPTWTGSAPCKSLRASGPSTTGERASRPSASTRVPMSDAERPLMRRLPIGAECLRSGGVHFRVWAPRAKRVTVVLGAGGDEGESALAAETSGYFSGFVPEAAEGTLYRFRLDEGGPYPDPASRFQPEGPSGPSRVVDPATFRWTDAGWAGAPLREQIIYELHVGTFTAEGTWEAARKRLGDLADLGITCIEMMPVAEFPGRFGWGYDGVNLFAPRISTASPTTCAASWTRRMVTASAVILDVVYNHFGPDGNYLREFSPDYFTDRHPTDWGEAINFDGPGSGPVREFFLANARAWIDEFHMDGLRLDATQSIFDESDEHVLAAIGREVRAAARGRETIIVAENEPQQTRLVRPVERGGYGLDGLWNDDLHHCGDGRPHGQARGLLHRLPGLASGADLGGEVGLSLPGAALQVAAEPPRHAGARSAALGLRRLHREPRSGRQFRPRPAPAPDDEPRPLPGDDGLSAPLPAHAHAVPGTGVRLLRPVPVLRRPPGRASAIRCARGARRSWRSSRASPRPR